jgi:hypothetical protein
MWLGIDLLHNPAQIQKGQINMSTPTAPALPSVSTKKSWLARSPLFAFFSLAFLLTWLAALPSLLFDAPFRPFQTLGAFGPLVSAVIVSAALGGD